MNFHFYRYVHNFAIGIGIEKTFTNYWALRLWIGLWCFTISWRWEGGKGED